MPPILVPSLDRFCLWQAFTVLRLGYGLPAQSNTPDARAFHNHRFRAQARLRPSGFDPRRAPAPWYIKRGRAGNSGEKPQDSRHESKI